MKKNILRNAIISMSLSIMPFTAFASEEIYDIDDLKVVPNHVWGGIAFNYLSPHFLRDVELVSRDMQQSVSINFELRLDEITDLLIGFNPDIKNKGNALDALKIIVNCKFQDIQESTNDRKPSALLENKALLYKKLYNGIMKIEKTPTFCQLSETWLLKNLTKNNIEITRLAFFKFSDRTNKQIKLMFLDELLLKKCLYALKGITKGTILTIEGRFNSDSLLMIQDFLNTCIIDERFNQFNLIWNAPLSGDLKEDLLFDLSETGLTCISLCRSGGLNLRLVPPPTLKHLTLNGITFRNDNLAVLCRSLEEKKVSLKIFKLINNNIKNNDLKTILPIIKNGSCVTLNNPISEKGFQFLKKSLKDLREIQIQGVAHSLFKNRKITQGSSDCASKRKEVEPEAVVANLNEDTDLTFTTY